MLHALGFLIGGAIIGLIGKFVAPGDRDNIPLWLTVVCGIVGALIGYSWLGRNDNSFDWMAFFVSIIIAAVLVVVAAGVTGRKKA